MLRALKTRERQRRIDELERRPRKRDDEETAKDLEEGGSRTGERGERERERVLWYENGQASRDGIRGKRRTTQLRE